MISQRHVYDIDLIGLHQDIDKNNKISPENVEAIRYGFEYYFLNHDLDINHYLLYSLPHIVIINEPIFFNALAVKLSIIDAYKIPLLLDYQINKVPKSNNKFFIGGLEHHSYPSLEQYSIKNKKERLEKVVDWIREKNKNNIQFHKSDLSIFVWDMNESSKLSHLSRKLKLKGYTDKPTDFKKGIENGIPFKWNKSPELYARLIYVLVKEREVLKLKKGKGFFKIAAQLIFDYSEKSTEKFSLKELSSRINKNPYKYPKTVASIEKLLYGIF